MVCQTLGLPTQTEEFINPSIIVPGSLASRFGRTVSAITALPYLQLLHSFKYFVTQQFYNQKGRTSNQTADSNCLLMFYNKR